MESKIIHKLPQTDHIREMIWTNPEEFSLPASAIIAAFLPTIKSLRAERIPLQAIYSALRKKNPEFKFSYSTFCRAVRHSYAEDKKRLSVSTQRIPKSPPTISTSINRMPLNPKPEQHPLYEHWTSKEKDE